MADQLMTRIINHWNDDPIMSAWLTGRKLQASFKDDVLSVAWVGKQPFFVSGGIEAAGVGWSDVMTDLIDAINREMAS